MDLADQFNDDTNEWLLIEHRLRLMKDNFDYIYTRTNRECREIKVSIFEIEMICILILNVFFFLLDKYS